MKTKILTMLQKESRGQSLVELAYSLTLILTLLLGAVEVGLTLFQYVTIRDAAQEGANYASINPTDDAGIKYRAVAAASDVIPQLETAAITIARNNNKSCEGQVSSAPNSITVTITFYHDIIFPLVKPLFGADKIKLTTNITNVILQPICP